jgi:hypothetical protein
VPFVLDASVTLGWCFLDERQRLTEIANDMLENSETAFVPLIWWFEIRHAALMGIRRERVAPELVAGFLLKIRNAPIESQRSQASVPSSPLPIVSSFFL